MKQKLVTVQDWKKNPHVTTLLHVLVAQSSKIYHFSSVLKLQIGANSLSKNSVILVDRSWMNRKTVRCAKASFINSGSWPLGRSFRTCQVIFVWIPSTDYRSQAWPSKSLFHNKTSVYVRSWMSGVEQLPVSCDEIQNWLPRPGSNSSLLQNYRFYT